MDVSPRGLRAFRSRPASRRQRSDLVALAHIKEQSRLSLGSYHTAGTNSFGLGSALSKPDYSQPELQTRTQAFIDAYKALTNGRENSVWDTGRSGLFASETFQIWRSRQIPQKMTRNTNQMGKFHAQV